MNTTEIEVRLLAAQKRMKAAVVALAPKHKGGEYEEYDAAREDLLLIEREFARATSEEYADVSDFPVSWDFGAPLPHVVANDYRIFLLFYVRDIDPDWDGTYATVKNPADGEAELLALVEFKQYASFRMGTPNDEVFSGHTLSGKGMDGYTAQIVRNSRWISELEAINKVHSGYSESAWRGLIHYVLWFHDSTFECVAQSYEVEIFRESVSSLLSRACSRLH